MDQLAALLAADDDPHPVADWALRWLAHHRPNPVPPVLCHGDYRTGNYRVAGGSLTGILDWDFAGWSDPDEDIAWFCAKAGASAPTGARQAASHRAPCSTAAMKPHPGGASIHAASTIGR